MIEFTSERKMMTAIFKNEDGKTIAFSKGADSAIIPKLKKGTFDE
jgi:magnesium-transporting ATPase (P-type)